MRARFPSRYGDWKQQHLIEDVLEAVGGSLGPFHIRHGPEWDMYLDMDHVPVPDLPIAETSSQEMNEVLNRIIDRVNAMQHGQATKTLRQRLLAMEIGIDSVKVDRRLKGFSMLLVREPSDPESNP